jgi:glycosyltransferase involved in cell wall biosynthesis
MPSSLPNTVPVADVQAVATSKWPRIALVTPALNAAKYIEQTIRSVLAQGYPNLDYFIVDGGSTDGTVEIIRKYDGQISGWVSEQDNGMYDAINKGFSNTSGEVMGWISATDQLHIGGLLVVGSVFRDLPQVEWITGRPTLFGEEGMTIAVMDQTRWSRWRFLAGANRAIQQESTYWRRSLWEKAGGYLDTSGQYGIMSDFELWVRFFRYAKLYSVDAVIGGFRATRDSRSQQILRRCLEIHDEIIEEELERVRGGKALKIVGRIGRAVRPIPVVRGIWRILVMDSLYRLPGPDWAPVIKFPGDKWRLYKK